MDLNAQNTHHPEHQGANFAAAQKSEGNSMVKSVGIIAMAIVFLALVLFGGMLAMKKEDTGMDMVKKEQYQAVFLTNGQVYFGKIEDMNKSSIKLTKIYYLQVQQSVQPAEKKDDSQAQISLAKLGDELHGPEDTMYIAKDQMLFWENMKDSGKVVQAIKNAGK